MPHKSVGETGARPGDKVRMVGSLATAMPGQFFENTEYTVFQEGSQMKVWGHLTEKVRDRSYPVSWAGYGYLWELIE